MPPTDHSGTSASTSSHQTSSSKKGIKFWLIIMTACICPFLTAFEFSSTSTALPTIASSLHADSFTWVGSAYSLSAAAFLPMSGGLCQAFGRRPTILLTIALFALGSGICGGATSMNMLVAGRVIQGLGGAGTQSIADIIVSDLVSLQDRATFSSLFAFAWSISASSGPVVGGALAAAGQWRWLFYLNLPVTAVAALAVLLFLDLPIPPGAVREKLGRIDWIGIFLFILSAVSCMIGLTWGGITAPWMSAKVLVPLVLGAFGLVIFFVFEANYAKFPIVPFVLMKNRTSLSGYVQTFLQQIGLVSVVYFLPVYFQACKGSSAVQSGAYTLSFLSVGLGCIITGLLIRTTPKYRLPMWIGWIISIISFGLMSTIDATTSIGKVVGLVFLTGIGCGFLETTPMYPIQAPLSVTENASSMTFWWFLRSFGIVWGVTIGSTVLQNELKRKIPTSFLESIPQGVEIMYALIPSIPSLSPAMRIEVQASFASSLQVLWRVMAYISVAGFVASFFMKQIQLKSQLDAEWTLQMEGEKEMENA